MPTKLLGSTIGGKSGGDTMSSHMLSYKFTKHENLFYQEPGSTPGVDRDGDEYQMQLKSL